MQPERLPPDSPREWLNRAKSDLAIAQTQIEGAYLEDLCYHAQQCAEKSFKATLLHHIGSFPFIHDLSELANRLQSSGISLTDDVRNAVALTEYAVEGRYPGPDEPVTEEQWQTALKMATYVLEWAAKQIP